MTSNEITWLLGLILFGSVAGIVAGWIAARKSKGMESAIIGAVLSAMSLPMMLCFLAGLSDSYQPKGFSVVNALLSGVGMMFYLGIGMTICSAPASVVTAVASYAGFSRCRRRSKEAEQPVP